MNSTETGIIICECFSMEHQMVLINPNDGDNEIFVQVHLATHRNFFKRILVAIKYVFGYKSRFGAWDEFIWGPEQTKQLETFLANRSKG